MRDNRLMTMIEPQDTLNTKAPYDPMAALREWTDATADPSVPGSVRWIEEKDAYGRKKNAQMRLALISEEYHEVVEELLDLINGRGDRIALAKELADLLYVVYGAAYDFEIPLMEVFDAVHTSNMTKVGESGKVVRTQSGKIAKGPHYVEPDIATVFFGDIAN